MSDADRPTDPPWPAQAALSTRIQQQAEHLAERYARWQRSDALPVPFHGDVELVPERPPLERIDPDPEHLTRLKTATAREVDRPPAINKALTRVVPQFFLRNTDRIERHASTRYLDFTGRELINLDFLDDVEAARRCHFDRFDLRFESSSLLVAMLLAERNVVMVETRWHEVFGRPNPVE